MENKVLDSMPLVSVAVSLMAGILLGDVVALSQTVLMASLAGCLVIALLSWKMPGLQSAMICLCFVVLGLLLMQRQKASLAVSWPEGDLNYEAVVLTAPVEKPKTMAVDILLTSNQRKLKCYLQKDGRSRGLKVGDGLEIQSRIRENSHWRKGTFDYHRYLEVHGFTGSTYVASWKWRKAQVSLDNLSRLQRTQLSMLRLRSQLLQRFATQGAADEAYAVVAAMALGDKTALTQELKDTYSVTGASHVLALSGLHLGIIYMLLSLLIVNRRWRMASQLLIVLCIWAFVLLVGMSVSVVRSALMLSVYALLSLGHRDRMSVNTLAFTAIVLLMVNPLSLFDVGFQMSFMAVLAILLFVPLGERVLSQEFLMSHRVVRWIWSLVVVSCAAQVGVAPLIAYYFQRLSVFFLVTNLVVVPSATLILWFSLATLVVPSCGLLLFRLVAFQNLVLTWIAALPDSSINGLHPTVLQVVMTYIVIGCVYLLIVRLCAGIRR